jgi:predicted Rossmann-fold nucleotide-binding protein
LISSKSPKAWEEVGYEPPKKKKNGSEHKDRLKNFMELEKLFFFVFDSQNHIIFPGSYG